MENTSMKSRAEILESVVLGVDEKTDSRILENRIQIAILQVLLDCRDLLSVKSKSRRLLLEEIPMTDRERELLNSLEEKE